MLDNIPIFRAKKKDSNEFVEGFLTRSRCYNGVYILPSNYNQNENIEGYEDEIYEIDITTLSIHFPNMLAKDSDRYDSSGEKDLRVFASLQLDGKGGDLVGYVDGHIKYNVAERYVISEDGVLFLRDIIPNIKKYTLDKEIASWYKIYGIQQ